MEPSKLKKKALRRQLKRSLREAISSLELPEANAKVKKIIKRNSKQLAGIFADMLKKQARKDRKARKSINLMKDVLSGKKKEKRGNEVAATV